MEQFLAMLLLVFNHGMPGQSDLIEQDKGRDDDPPVEVVYECGETIWLQTPTLNANNRLMGRVTQTQLPP